MNSRVKSPKDPIDAQRELSQGSVVGPDELDLPPLSPPLPNGGPTPSYPILTEEMAYAPSPLANSGGGAGRSTGSTAAGAAPRGALGPTVNRALQEVLGWKIKSDDAVGFVGALTQSFQLKVSEGAVVSTWTPRSYVVQTDLSGGVSGAQASIYTMAKTLTDQLLPLLDGLYPLDPGSDAETVTALKQLARNQVNNLTSEFGYLGGPRVMRVQQYFQMLLGVGMRLERRDHAPHEQVRLEPRLPPRHSPLLRQFQDPLEPELFKGGSHAPLWPRLYWTNPDSVLGTLGDLRDQLGLSELVKPNFVNTVADEQNVTNFRIIVDYANSLLNGWQNSIQFFAGRNSQFLGTQLVVISRQLGVISETVDEVRFVLDSVFVGPAQRETLQLDFAKHAISFLHHLPPIYLEDLLQWMQDFVGGEAQDVIQNGGKLGLGEDFIRMIQQLYYQAYGLYQIAQGSGTAGIGTARVQQSLYKLTQQLLELYHMAKPVSVAYIPPRH